MAEDYQIVVNSDPALNNAAFSKDISLTAEQLNGVAVTLFALFGADSPLARIYVNTESGPIRVDYGKMAKQLDNMILQGPEVQEISSNNWLIDLKDRQLMLTKRYSMRILSRDQYIVQFSSLDFLGAVIMVFNNAGLDYGNYIADLHDGDKLVEQVELF